MDFETHARLRTSACGIDLLPNGALEALVDTMTGNCRLPAAARAEVSWHDLIVAAGQALGLRRWPRWMVTHLFAVHESMQAIAAEERCTAWVKPPPMSRSDFPSGCSDADFDDYIQRHAAWTEAPALPPRNAEQWTLWAMGEAERVAERVAGAYEAEIEDARKAIAPKLAQGASRQDVIAIARHRAPMLLDQDVAALVDEEAAWWLRWRHERAVA